MNIYTIKSTEFKSFRKPIVLAFTFLFMLYSKAQQNQLFKDVDEIYSFELPTRSFKQIDNHYFKSEELTASIKFNFETCYVGDDKIVDIEDVFKKVKKQLKVTYQSLKKDRFTVSGFDASGNIVYIKGTAEELIVRNNPDNQNELNWLWTKIGTVTFKYPPRSKTEMDKIIATFLKTYQVNLGLL
jgi:hypothetical protein